MSSACTGRLVLSVRGGRWRIAALGAELSKSMTDFMTAQCKRLNKEQHVKWMDVVNETIVCDMVEWRVPQLQRS